MGGVCFCFCLFSLLFLFLLLFFYDNTNCWQGCKTTGTHILWWWKYKIIKPLLQTLLSVFFLNKVKHRTTIRPNNPGTKFLFLLGKNLSSHKNPYIYITSLLMITKSWKQPRCFSTGEWINTMPMVQQYNGILLNNEKELLIHATWMNLKYIWLNGRSQM